MIHLRGAVGYVVGEALTELGGGQGFYIRPPAGETWRVISWRATFTTDATAVNRYMSWHIYDGTNFASTRRHNLIHAASLTYIYGANPSTRNDGFLTSEYAMLPWDMDIFVNNTWYWWVEADGIQVGDHFTQIYAFVEKWLEE